MFRNALGLVAAVALTAVAPAGTPVEFVITIDGDQNGVETPAFGSGTATLDLDTNLFTWEMTFQDLSAAETAAHFHGAAPQCQGAAPQITLPPGSPKAGSQVISAQQAVDLMSGLWYVNIHSTAHPPGEIRGQVMPGPLGDPIGPSIAESTVHIALETVASGLTAPNWGATAPGDDRLFVTDQNGTLWAIDVETGDKTVLLDVSGRLVSLGIFGKGSFDERGLLGVAFHPGYAKNGKLYTYTSEPIDGGAADFTTMPDGVDADHLTVIVEWTVPEPGNPASVVDPASARVLLRVAQPQFNHNAGSIIFGQDNRLYIALGDGGGADDKDGQGFIGGETLVGHGCLGNGQDLDTVLGAILRIDPDGNDSANGEYGIPGDNPFVGTAGVDEIFAYGFRNPFRTSVDRGTGDIYIADVGQNDIEEINILVAGGNFGWNQKEGTFSFVPNGNESGYATAPLLNIDPTLIDPIAEYDHDEGIAIVGGFVYRGTRIAPLIGRYIFGEFAVSFDNDGRLFHLADGNEIVEFPLFGQAAFGLSLLGFGEDPAGDLYVLANSTGVPFGETGVVMRIGRRPGDVDANGIVEFPDLLDVLSNWGPCVACPADLDRDGIVGFRDLLSVLSNWG